MRVIHSHLVKECWPVNQVPDICLVRAQIGCTLYWVHAAPIRGLAGVTHMLWNPHPACSFRVLLPTFPRVSHRHHHHPSSTSSSSNRFLPLYLFPIHTTTCSTTSLSPHSLPSVLLSHSSFITSRNERNTVQTSHCPSPHRARFTILDDPAVPPDLAACRF